MQNRGEEPLISMDGDRLVILPDRRKMLRRVNLRAVFILLPVVVAIFALFAFLGSLIAPPRPPALEAEITFIPWFIFGLYATIYVAGVAAVRRQRLPIVTLSPVGISVQTMLTPVGLIPWDQVAEIRPYTMLYRYVGIVPRDLDGLCRRLGGRGALLIRANSWVAPLYDVFGLFVAPINIPQEYLPITANELADRIRDFRAARITRDLSPATPSTPGVWPPPPAGANL